MRNRLPLLFATLSSLTIVSACAFDVPEPPVPDKSTPADVNVKVTVHPGKSDVDTQHYAVQFLDKDGKLISETATMADGTATAKIEAGATVIVIGGPAAKAEKPKDPKDQTPPLKPGGPFVVKAVLNLKPGDDIQLDLAPPPSAPDPKKSTGKFTYNVTPMTGATKYLVTNPCTGGFTAATITDGAATFPATFDLFKACDKQKVTMLAFAYDANGLIGWSQAKDVELKAAGSAAAPAAWTAASKFDAQVTGLDPSIDSVSFARWSATGQPDVLASTKPSGSIFDASLAIATDSSAAVQTAVTAGPHQSQYIVESIAADLVSYKLDLATKLLPWLDASTFEVSTGKLHTPVKGTGTYDAFEAKIDLSRTETIVFTDKDADKKPRTNTYTYPLAISWTVITDKAGDVTLPKLVGDLAMYNPTATDAAPVTVKDTSTTTVTSMTKDTATVSHTRILDLQDAKDYDAARKDIFGGVDRAEGTGVQADVAKDHGARTSVYE